jgi:hypothetical protein
MVAAAQVFPALKASHKKQLLATGYKIPVPTYIPAGFFIDTVITKTGKTVNVEDKVLFIQYSKKLPDGTYQGFYVDAGFDGLGSLWYKSETVQSGVGKIEMYYQPFEEVEEGQKPEKVMDLIGTEWFTINKVEFHVFGIVTPAKDEQEEEFIEDEKFDNRTFVPIPKNEFKKILQSLRILK